MPIVSENDLREKLRSIVDELLENASMSRLITAIEMLAPVDRLKKSSIPDANKYPTSDLVSDFGGDATGANSPVLPNKSVRRGRRRRRRMSKEAHRAVSERMKKFWAKRHKERR